MNKFILLMILSVSTSTFAELKTYDGNKIDEIDLRNHSGNISFTKSESKKIELFIDRKKFGSNCELKIDSSGDELEVEVNKKEKNGEECRVNFDLKIPEGIEVKLKNGAGNLSVMVPAKSLDFKLGAGNVSIKGDVNEIEGKIGSGNIEFTGRATEIDLKSGAGNVRINLPADSSVSSDIKVGFGNIKSDFKNDPKGKTEVEVKAGTGNIKVLKIN